MIISTELTLLVRLQKEFNMSNKETIEELFEGTRSPYAISLMTGISLKEVYHHIRLSEELKSRHKRKLREEKELNTRMSA